MLVTLPGIVMPVKLVQFSNARSPMLVTLPGMVTLVSVVLLSNASFPMLATKLEMTTAPPLPVYEKRVIASSLVV
jgi:hypothetical protein